MHENGGVFNKIKNKGRKELETQIFTADTSAACRSAVRRDH
jgi:hypothetical protein